LCFIQQSECGFVTIAAINSINDAVNCAELVCRKKQQLKK
jgi:hypothetical protein